MKKKNKLHTPEFKMDVAIEALKGKLTLAEISTKYDVHPRQVTLWREQLVKDGVEVFTSKHANRKTKDDVERDDLQRKVGQLTMEIEYLKKKLEK